MKAQAHGQGKAIFELKHKVVVALNKVGDRDTQQIGTDELEKTAQSLTPEGISPFVSCLLDTDSDQKSAIRKECVKLMGTLATFYETLILPHLPKMVTSIVKRLRDPDSMLRDVCVQTVGVLASKLLNQNQNQTPKVFLVLVRPFFEALGEQNKHVQSGSALCLARIIDNTHDPPLSLLHKMLTRTVKLLKNPHFMAKPALVELNRSIILAGGASTENILSTAIASIQEALKDSDWTTRKAASVALGEIGLNGGSFLGCLRASCIHSLESCRFDKVKPVRDAVLQALKYWRILPDANTPEPSETGSSLKENLCRGDSAADLSSITETGHRDGRLQKVNLKSTMGRIPLSVRKACQNYVGNPHHLKSDDWNVEIAVPGTHSLVESQNEESESSSVTKPLEMSADVTSMQDAGYEYVPMDDKQECSSVSNLATDNFETKFLTSSNDCFIKSGLQKPIVRSQQFDGEEISCSKQKCSIRTQNPRCSDSTVTDPSPQTAQECCVRMANEIICIQNQLSDIETKQGNMMHQLQMFTTGIMDALSTIQSRIVGLENVLDRFSQESVQGGRYSYSENSKFLRQSQNLASPRFSICTPRPFMDINNKQSGFLSVKNSESFEKKTFSRSKPRNSAGDSTDMWKNYSVKNARNFTEKNVLNSSGKDAQSMGSAQARKNDGIFSSTNRANARNGCSESNKNYWKCVKHLACEGDLNSAYMEALCSRDELILVELLSKTGPVIENLSVKTVNVLLSTLASYLLEGRFFSTIISWLQQVVEMSANHGPNCIALSVETKEQLLSAVQEVVNLNIFSHAERRSAAEIGMKLHHIWGKITES